MVGEIAVEEETERETSRREGVKMGAAGGTKGTERLVKVGRKEKLNKEVNVGEKEKMKAGIIIVTKTKTMRSPRTRAAGRTRHRRRRWSA